MRMGGCHPCGARVGVNSFHFTWNGRPWLPAMGEFQYSRYPAEFWEEELLKIKAGGVTIVPTYAFWIHHEESEGVFDWSGRRDLRRFVSLCAKHGLWVVVRMGPFCHGEARNGGLPDWLYGQPLIPRSNDPRYLFYVQRLYREIGRQLKGLMFQDGGPIIGLQVENEFMASQAPWETTQNPDMVYTAKGAGGFAHLRLLKRMAEAAGIRVPLLTCTGWGDSPVSPREAIPMFGGYAFYAWLDDPSKQDPTDFFLFRAMHGRRSPTYDTRAVPFACCELGGGMQVFYKNRPIVPPESVESMHVAQLGSGSNLLGYYVYHGGSNPVGRHAFLNEHRCPRISYDYQAPLGEYGQRRPHYDLLRRQFLFLQAFGDRLAAMTVALPAGAERIAPADTRTVRWCARAKDGAGFVFLQNYQDHATLHDHAGLKLEVRTNRETLAFPPGRGRLTLRKGACAILPFNFEMSGLLLKSASVQPIAVLDDHYFFFAPDGFPAEYAFDPTTYASVDAKPIGPGRFAVHPGTDSGMTFTLRDGSHVRVVTLTDEQSRQFWCGAIGGRERAFLSKAGLVFNRGKLAAYQTGAEVMRVAAYDSCAGFRWRTVKVPRRRVKVSVRKIEDGKVAVRIPRSALEGLHELYLRIAYAGDTGSAYLDGELIADNFANGTPWEIGLRRFAPRILKTELVLVLTPLRQGEGAHVAYSGMAAMKAAAGKKRMGFHSIRAIPEYRAVLPSFRRTPAG